MWGRELIAARDADRETPQGRPRPALMAAIAGTGTYGGYFGAAQGVLLMAVLGVLENADPRCANGVKNLLASAANIAAAIVFVATGRVVWPAALALMAGAMVGGYILGFTQVFVVAFLPSTYRDLITFTLLLVILVVRPTGQAAPSTTSTSSSIETDGVGVRGGGGVVVHGSGNHNKPIDRLRATR